MKQFIEWFSESKITLLLILTFCFRNLRSFKLCVMAPRLSFYETYGAYFLKHNVNKKMWPLWWPKRGPRPSSFKRTLVCISHKHLIYCLKNCTRHISQKLFVFMIKIKKKGLLQSTEWKSLKSILQLHESSVQHCSNAVIKTLGMKKSSDCNFW